MKFFDNKANDTDTRIAEYNLYIENNVFLNVHENFFLVLSCDEN